MKNMGVWKPVSLIQSCFNTSCFIRTQVVKFHKSWITSRNVCNLTRKTFWVNTFHSLSQVRETIYTSKERIRKLYWNNLYLKDLVSKWPALFYSTASGVPNGGFFLNALKTLFRPSRIKSRTLLVMPKNFHLFSHTRATWVFPKLQRLQFFSRNFKSFTKVRIVLIPPSLHRIFVSENFTFPIYMQLFLYKK